MVAFSTKVKHLISTPHHHEDANINTVSITEFICSH